jgi:hypothetical protein
LRAGSVPQPQPAAPPVPVGRAPEEAITDPRLPDDQVAAVPCFPWTSLVLGDYV